MTKVVPRTKTPRRSLAAKATPKAARDKGTQVKPPAAAGKSRNVSRRASQHSLDEAVAEGNARSELSGLLERINRNLDETEALLAR